MGPRWKGCLCHSRFVTVLTEWLAGSLWARGRWLTSALLTLGGQGVGKGPRRRRAGGLLEILGDAGTAVTGAALFLALPARDWFSRAFPEIPLGWGPFYRWRAATQRT